MSQETHLFEYRYKGGGYRLEMVAGSEREATERIHAAALHAKYLGVSAGKFPAIVGWWVPAYCWLRNAFARGRNLLGMKP